MQTSPEVDRTPLGIQSAESAARSTQPPLLIPLLILLAGSLLIRIWDLDRLVETHFWSATAGWALGAAAWARFLYEFGTWPAIVAGVLGLSVCLYLQYRKTSLETRRLGLFLALVLLIGPGFIVNLVFKEHFGRPRPSEVHSFGGREAFVPLGVAGNAEPGRSFPSGHASMGFYWMGLFVYFWQDKRRIAWLFLALALLYGFAMGLARMAQGSHWPSDVLWSAGFVYLSAWVIYRWRSFLLRFA